MVDIRPEALGVARFDDVTLADGVLVDDGLPETGLLGVAVPLIEPVPTDDGERLADAVCDNVRVRVTVAVSD